MEGILILVRHGESLWNAQHLWTGLIDIGLSEKGKKESISAALQIADIHLDCAFTSNLARARETLRLILEKLGIQNLQSISNDALNERDYGVYTGKNKLEVHQQLGDEEFLKLRRGWDYPIPNGESLKQVYARVTPYYEDAIAPLLRTGKHVLIVAHGNSLRALIKKLDNVSDEDITNIELGTGEIMVYRIDSEGKVASKEILNQ